MKRKDIHIRVHPHRVDAELEHLACTTTSVWEATATKQTQFDFVALVTVSRGALILKLL